MKMAIIRDRSYAMEDAKASLSTTVVFLMIIVILFGNGVHSLAMQQGVVNSPITVLCNVSTGIDIDRIVWSFNRTTILDYSPQDRVIINASNDTRFSITSDPTKLMISHLKKSDAGNYTCGISSHDLEDHLRLIIIINVLDGCPMLEYNEPLRTTSGNCSPGEQLAYSQECGFFCQEGYHLVGNSSTMCQGNGQLTNHLPRCEGINCTIDKLPAHLADERKICKDESQVRYGTICELQCTNGYNVNGNGTTRITCENGKNGVHNFPTCTEIQEEPREKNLKYLAFLVLLQLLLFFIGLLVWLGNKRYHKKMKKRMALYIDHAAENHEVMIEVLRKTKNAELTHLQGLSEIDISKKKVPVFATKSTSYAFSWYLDEIIRCVSKTNQDEGSRLKTDILGTTADNISHESELLLHSTDQQQDTTASTSYTDVVNAAFCNLIDVLEKKIQDTQVRKTKRSKVFKELANRFKERNRERSANETTSSTTNGSRLESLFRRTGQNREDSFSAICLGEIGRCLTSTDKIHMRYRVLQIMIEPYEVATSNV